MIVVATGAAGDPSEVLEVIEDRLSFPTRGAPIRYNLALETACENRRGVFQYNMQLRWGRAMGNEGKMGSSHSVCRGAVVCKVENNTQFLNEMHINISPSLIKDVMVRTPPGQH